MFSKLCGCFTRNKSFRFMEIGDGNVPKPMAVGQSLPTLKKPVESREPRTGLFRHILRLRRRTNDEKILLYEKRYLKKYLRQQNAYVSGMTVLEMRNTYRLLLESGQRKDFRLYCCHCLDGDCKADPKNATTDYDIKEVPFGGMTQMTVEDKVSEGGECSCTVTSITEKKELESAENQDNLMKKTVVENPSASVSKEGKTSATRIASVVRDGPRTTAKAQSTEGECSGAIWDVSETLVKESIESVEILVVLKSTEGGAECITIAQADSEVTTKLQSFEAKQTTVSSEVPKPATKENVQLQNVDQLLKETDRCKCSVVACDSQEITVKKDCASVALEKLKPSSAHESSVTCDNQEMTPKKVSKTNGKVQLQSLELPLKPLTEKQGKCSKESSVSVDNPEVPEENVGANEKILAQSVGDETNRGESDKGSSIPDKTGKMTPEEIETNNELHASVLKWFDSQDDILSFIGGSDVGPTYVSVKQPEP